MQGNATGLRSRDGSYAAHAHSAQPVALGLQSRRGGSADFRKGIISPLRRFINPNPCLDGESAWHQQFAARFTCFRACSRVTTDKTYWSPFRAISQQAALRKVDQRTDTPWRNVNRIRCSSIRRSATQKQAAIILSAI